jgi:asparagine synthase (glutamine-hydrolysing)
LDSWFRNELRELSADLLLDGRLASRGYFKMDAVRRLLEEHWSGAGAWQNQLWTLVMLESWHRMFIDARPAEAPSGTATLAMANS